MLCSSWLSATRGNLFRSLWKSRGRQAQPKRRRLSGHSYRSMLCSIRPSFPRRSRQRTQCLKLMETRAEMSCKSLGLGLPFCKMRWRPFLLKLRKTTKILHCSWNPSIWKLAWRIEGIPPKLRTRAKSDQNTKSNWKKKFSSNFSWYSNCKDKAW